MNKEELIYAVRYFVAVIFTGLALGILFALIKAPLESYDHESVNIPEEKSDYVAADPCGLDYIMCDNESNLAVTDSIIRTALIYEVDVEKALNIAYCESRFDPDAKNEHSSAAGVFQFLMVTFNETAERMNKTWTYKEDVYDQEKNIEAAIWLMAKGEYWRWSECL